MECPSEEVIEDDDALDGWFIEQRRKNERESVGVIEILYKMIELKLARNYGICR